MRGAEVMANLAVAGLTECEEIIERGLSTFVEVGEALLRIRDHRLYWKSHATFEAYCRERWGFVRRHANRLIEAAQVTKALGPIGPMPPNEAVARERLAADGARQNALDRSGHGRVRRRHASL